MARRYSINGYAPTLEDVRAVWALVSQSPRLSVREIAWGIGRGTGYAQAALSILELSGYIAREREKARTIRVLIPMYGYERVQRVA